MVTGLRTDLFMICFCAKPAVSRHHRRSRGSSFSAEVRSALKPMSPGKKTSKRGLFLGIIFAREVPKHSKLEHLSTTKKPAEVRTANSVSDE